MPIFSNAEARIKKLVVFAFWVKMPKVMLIAQVKKDIPKDLYNRSSYINGLVKSSSKLVKEYEKANLMFEKYKKKLINGEGIVRFVKSPEDLHTLMTKQTPRERKLMWSEAKGSPNVSDYQKEVRKFIESVNERPFVTSEKGKKPISLWQKAELDVRYNKQMEMLQTMLDQGIEYAWISSHPDCSKRCEKWQGKLVSLTKHGVYGFRIGKLDGHTVYSLPDIMEQVDKYGYHNNIICGFNCRHKLHAYTKGSSAPTSYSKEEVAKQRAIEQKIRMMERQIRLLKMNLNHYTIIDDKNAVRILKRRIKTQVAAYKSFCQKHGYAWYDYRIDVNDNNVYLVKGKAPKWMTIKSS